MNFNIDTIHHAGLITAQLDDVISQYERLGFSFTPLSLVKITIRPGEDPVYIGLGNRTAIFEQNYLEVVGIPDPEIWSAFPVEKRGPFNIDERLPLYTGMHIMHFGTDDIEKVRDAYVAKGQPISEVARLQRMVETPEGAKLMQAKAIAYPRDSNPEGLIQVAQHLTPELVLQKRHMAHANGATNLSECIVCSHKPDVMARKYGIYTGRPAVRTEFGYAIDLGLTRIAIVDLDGLNELVPGYQAKAPEFLAGFSVTTRNLDAAGEHLDAQNIRFQERNGRLIVGPDDACGSAVIFEAA